LGALVDNIVDHLLDGVADVDRDLGERIERGVRAG
jgi:phosphate uptake regulator